eukprot:NODE_1354_length_2507_cov_5.233193.p1 GENE.NODE_1354_length_2507_cov_5.233193~~NODE_1354_length_2507_cov_5.233193.p1  ORF type:complete len:725 (+),score=147.98 NODE_1354_length_2507_cov_5.233193:149-2323(+)
MSSQALPQMRTRIIAGAGSQSTPHLQQRPGTAPAMGSLSPSRIMSLDSEVMASSTGAVAFASAPKPVSIPLSTDTSTRPLTSADEAYNRLVSLLKQEIQRLDEVNQKRQDALCSRLSRVLDHNSLEAHLMPSIVETVKGLLSGVELTVRDQQAELAQVRHDSSVRLSEMQEMVARLQVNVLEAQRQFGQQPQISELRPSSWSNEPSELVGSWPSGIEIDGSTSKEGWAAPVAALESRLRTMELRWLAPKDAGSLGAGPVANHGKIRLDDDEELREVLATRRTHFQQMLDDALAPTAESAVPVANSNNTSVVDRLITPRSSAEGETACEAEADGDDMRTWMEKLSELLGFASSTAEEGEAAEQDNAASGTTELAVTTDAVPGDAMVGEAEFGKQSCGPGPARMLLRAWSGGENPSVGDSITISEDSSGRIRTDSGAPEVLFAQEEFYSPVAELWAGGYSEVAAMRDVPPLMGRRLYESGRRATAHLAVQRLQRHGCVAAEDAVDGRVWDSAQQHAIPWRHHRRDVRHVRGVAAAGVWRVPDLLERQRAAPVPAGAIAGGHADRLCVEGLVVAHRLALHLAAHGADATSAATAAALRAPRRVNVAVLAAAVDAGGASHFGYTVFCAGRPGADAGIHHAVRIAALATRLDHQPHRARWAHRHALPGHGPQRARVLTNRDQRLLHEVLIKWCAAPAGLNRRRCWLPQFPLPLLWPSSSGVNLNAGGTS